ncbi:MAG: hypothetical protein H0U52_15885, partial [Chloroflexi bacterium]|nr:hypothetical protein [Chloroflexota bacterium]
PSPSTGSAATVERFTVGGSGAGSGAASGLADSLLAASVALALNGFDWQIPGLALSVPGLLVILAITLQLGGGLAWLPLVRRKLGAFGVPARPKRRR